MSGHKNSRNNLPRRPADPVAARATAALDQLAADVNSRRDAPHLAALEPHVTALLSKFRELCGHLDEVTAGAVMMFTAQVFTAHVNGQGTAEGQAMARTELPDLARLAGAALYTGSRLPAEMTCPFKWSTGNPCGKPFTAPTRERLDVLVKAHVWQNHPGESWPPKEDEEDGPEAAPKCKHPTDALVVSQSGTHCEACGQPVDWTKDEQTNAIPGWANDGESS